MKVGKEGVGRGHRARLKTRFERAPIRSLLDYEVLELYLFGALKQKDTKEIAKKLLTKFNSLIAVISADPADLIVVEGVGPAIINHLKLLLDIFTRLYIEPDKKNIHILNNWNAVLNYCTLSMGFKTKEMFRILFLDKKNLLICDEVFDNGTVDKIVIYPREIVKRAIYHNASAIIFVHNHPSGDSSPSKEDIEMTKKIVSALANVNIAVHDHIIMAKYQNFSFRSNNLL